ncbi:MULTISPECIES: hypothetical protein [Lactococcus]|jgi:hypothetical protein|uniref:Uncharacterized protein n=2 Tax=Lactococcus TaxID=1357 RepID=A0A387BKM3_9LACT|nr:MULTISPECIES: hypothetical protein [Lactococcus]AYG01510.1 hypothetical protein D7I46_10820 [Lactococcus allomyrinae]MCL2112414.1 hypothetical protein [Streptococcaceae bacterium]QDK70411.1 hypothetical protein FLP15_03530 [Lactococcus protaetiae]
MFFVLIIFLAALLFVRGLFHFVLPALLILLVLRVFLGGLMLLFSPHFIGTVLILAFIIWLVKASRGGRRYY